jgi:hypothetical protein
MIRLQRLGDSCFMDAIGVGGRAWVSTNELEGLLRHNYVLRRTRYSLFALIVPRTAAQDKQAKGHVARQDEKDARLRCVGGMRRAKKCRF